MRELSLALAAFAVLATPLTAPAAQRYEPPGVHKIVVVPHPTCHASKHPTAARQCPPQRPRRKG